jgi:hypothetical protein
MDRQARIVAGEIENMTQEDIIRMAREAGFPITNHLSGRQDIAGQSVARFRRFASLVAAAEREKVAHWMRNCGYATGHGDTIEDLLDHLGTQIAERLLMERAACADICDQHASVEGIAQRCAAEIRARSKT